MRLDGIRILLAEDNPTNRLVAVQMLESLGAVVTPASDGAEALDLVGRDTFDVLLIDVEMPRISGLEVIRRLHGDGAGGAPPAVALTAYAAPRQQAEIMGAGAAGVITKPIVSIERFGEAVRRFMRAAQAARPDRLPAEIDEDAYRGLAAAVGPQALKDLLPKVDADIAAAYDRMDRALASGDMMELRAATHILIAVGGAVGAVGLQGLARRLNRAAHMDDAAAIAELGAAAKAESARVRAFLDRERHG